MEFEFGKARTGQCMFCLRWNNSCFPFRIVENASLPNLFRVLYTFKNVICPFCREKGHQEIDKMARQYMDEYIGG